MKLFNVYSAKLKVINKDGSVKTTDSFVYKRSVPTAKGNEKKSVTDPQIIKARDSKGLMRQMLNRLKYKAKVGEYFVLQIKTTKGQYYFSNMRK